MKKLLSTVCHEVRNPLGVINLHAELIKRNPQAAMNSAEIISRTSKQLENILTELLDCSKAYMLDKKEEDLEQVVKESINLIKPLYKDKKVELKFKNHLNRRFKLSIDREKIHQVLFNLLKNALEASGQGQKVQVIMERNDSILIKIKDQGCGVPVCDREKVFETYFTTKREGSGIGLARSRKIIQAHEGSLYIDPDGQEGTTFIIKLREG